MRRPLGRQVTAILPVIAWVGELCGLDCGLRERKTKKLRFINAIYVLDHHLHQQQPVESGKERLSLDRGKTTFRIGQETGG